MMRIDGFKTGEWAKARRVLFRLPQRLKKRSHSGLGELAKASARRIRNNIFAQNYGHAPLADVTVEAKLAAGKDPRILIEDGEYVRSITDVELGSKGWGVGVTDVAQAAKGAGLEFGTKTSPSRPHYRVELARIRTGAGLAPLKDGIRKVLEGLD